MRVQELRARNWESCAVWQHEMVDVDQLVRRLPRFFSDESGVAA